jgi:flagellar biosynthesis protein FlhB|tara:strand:- start:1520 stop:1789 length:270 start_codon:yes stop_codon:yes gene_type:complete
MTQNNELYKSNLNLKNDISSDDIMVDDLSSFIIGYIKDEISKPNIKTEIIKPLLIHLLYYIIPFIIVFVLINFITTILAVFIAFRFKKN